jgi:hypothetical protein
MNFPNMHTIYFEHAHPLLLFLFIPPLLPSSFSFALPPPEYISFYFMISSPLASPNEIKRVILVFVGLTYFC